MELDYDGNSQVIDIIITTITTTSNWYDEYYLSIGHRTSHA